MTVQVKDPHQPPYKTGPTISLQQKANRHRGCSDLLRLPRLAGGKGWRAAGSLSRAELFLPPPSSSPSSTFSGGPIPPCHTNIPKCRGRLLASQGLTHTEPQQNRGAQNVPTQLAGEPRPHPVTQQNLEQRGEAGEHESQPRPDSIYASERRRSNCLAW